MFALTLKQQCGMYKALIIDDNKLARVMLSQMLAKIDEIELAGEFEDAPSAISTLMKADIDMLFLDAGMPVDISDLQLLKKSHKKPLLLLLTNDPGCSVNEELGLDVVDYIIKPFSVAGIIPGVGKAIKLLKTREQKINTTGSNNIFIRDGKTIRKILLETVLWLEAKGDYVKVVTQYDSLVIHTTLKNFEKKLMGKNFIRIHRGYIVSVNKIDYIEDGSAIINGISLPVSKTYKNNLLQYLQLL
jgi:DNA-binding LytR/AlgR family response regulator